MRILLSSVLLLAGFVRIASAATVEGIPIHSTTHGKGPKTIVFVHGWTCDETSWDAQVPVFEKDYRVITLDLPGHGKSGSPKSGALTIDLFAKAIEAVRVEAGAGKIVLVGHSMGTPVIRQYARLYPQNVAGLVPVDGVLRLSGSPSAPNANAMQGAEGRKNRENMIRGMFGKGTTPPLQDHIMKMMMAPPETTAYQAMAAMFVPSNWTEETMPFPALGIYADHSTAHNAEYFKKIFPNGRSVEVTGAGHFVMMEKPAEFNKLLKEFLPQAKY
jgi:pimeloyl-ACP methyl ester carboxylesterase